MIIVAHRGASGDAPENTLAAFSLAWEQGADAIECDCRLTGDGHIVVIHDDTTRRTTGKKLSVAGSTLDELRALDAGRWRGRRWQGQRIPTIHETLAAVPHGKKIFIEIKCGPEIIPPLDAAIRRSRLSRSQVMLISFSEEVVSACKRHMPGIKACLLVSHKRSRVTRRLRPSLAGLVATLKKTAVDGVDVRTDRAVNERFAMTLAEEKLELHAWNVNTCRSARRLRALGAASATTDRPAWLRSKLA